MTDQPHLAQSGRRRSRPIIVILPADEGRKGKHLAVLTHRGGGWWEARCMGQAKACVAGTCKHIADMRFDKGGRPIKPVPRD